MNKINVPCLYLYPDKCRQKLKNTIDYNNKKIQKNAFLPPSQRINMFSGNRLTAHAHSYQHPQIIIDCHVTMYFHRKNKLIIISLGKVVRKNIREVRCKN